MTQNHIRPSADSVDVYELECKVNRHYYGLANFLLGYHEHVLEILEPEALKIHLQTQIKKIKYA